MFSPEPLLQLVCDGDVVGADALLSGLSVEDRREARTWFTRSRGLSTDLLLERMRAVPPPAYDQWASDPRGYQHAYEEYAHALDLLRVWQSGLEWAFATCAVRLLAPAAAAQRLRALQSQPVDQGPDQGEQVCRAALLDQGAAWAGSFVEALSRAKGAPLAPRHARLVRAAVSRHQLPCPTGAAFASTWLVGVHEGRPVLQVMREDDLMPAILEAYVTTLSTRAPRDFPAAVATLVVEGQLDRAHVVQLLFAALTAPRRPSAQQTLADLVIALAVDADEVPGGLPLLLGLLAASHRSVATAVFPLAVALVADSAGLTELVTTVLARPEKGLRTALLKAATRPDTVARVGVSDVVDALHVLGGGDDAQLSSQVERAIARLSPTPPATRPGDDVPDALGLWDLPVSADPPRDPRGRSPADTRSSESLVLDLFAQRGSASSIRRGGSVDALLVRLERGEVPPGLLLSTCRRLLATGDLPLAALGQRMEELFLGGAMRHLWDDALVLADLATARAKRPSGLSTYLRLLAGYAVEAPPTALPSHLAALAAEKGSTKAHHEVRRLRDVAARGAAAAALRTPAPAPPLWRQGPPAPIEAATTPTTVPVWPDLYAGVQALVERDHRRHWEGGQPVTELARLTEPSTDLAALVAAAHRDGVPPTPAVLPEHEHHFSSSAWFRVLQLWAAKQLTLETHWAYALHSIDDMELQQELARERDELTRAGRPLDSTYGVTELAQLLRPRPVVAFHEGPGPRLIRLLWSESLLRAGRAPVLLSTPTHLDGTLEIADLLTRLETSRAAGVGPVDLATALHRLRRVDPREAEELDLPTVLVAPELMWPPGERGVPVDVVAVLRAHVRHGRSSWSWVPAARLHAEPRPSVVVVDDLRVHACDLDQALAATPSFAGTTYAPTASHRNDVLRVLATTSAPLGVRAHQLLVDGLCSSESHSVQGTLTDARALVAQDRLVPEHAVEAVRRRLDPNAYAMEHHPWRREAPFLAQLARGLEGLFAQGQLREVWPSALAVTADCVRRHPDVEGLPALLDLMARYADEASHPETPDADHPVVP